MHVVCPAFLVLVERVEGTSEEDAIGELSGAAGDRVSSVMLGEAALR
jgi:hypothetical protein